MCIIGGRTGVGAACGSICFILSITDNAAGIWNIGAALVLYRGHSNIDSACGAFYCSLYGPVSYSGWYFGAD